MRRTSGAQIQIEPRQLALQRANVPNAIPVQLNCVNPSKADLYELFVLPS